VDPAADSLCGGEAQPLRRTRFPEEALAGPDNDGVDLQVQGGFWRLTMLAGPEQHEIHWKGVYREVVEPERLVFTVTDQPDDDRYELIVVLLIDLGDGRTEMQFEQLGLMSPEEYERAGSGWSTFFDRIDERLAG